MADSANLSSQPETTSGNDDDAAEINISIDNIMCTFSAKSHLNLKHIALYAWNIEHNLEKNVLILQLRKPRCSAILRNTGNITCTGCDSEAAAYKAARRIVRIIQRAGYREKVQLGNFRINNIHATTSIPSRIDLLAIKRDTPDHETTYEPELGGSGLTYRVNVSPVDESGRPTHVSYDTKQNPYVVTFNIHHTGSIGIFGRNMRLIEEACGRLFEKLQNYLKAPESDENDTDKNRNSQASKRSKNASSRSQMQGKRAKPIRRSRGLRKLLGPAAASDEEDEYGVGLNTKRRPASAKTQRSATTGSTPQKRQLAGVLDYERSDSSADGTPSPDTSESEEDDDEETEEDEEDDLEYDDESSPSVVDVDDDDDDDEGPPPPIQPMQRPRRTIERSWQPTASQESPAGALRSAASASASASASSAVITRIDRSQSQGQRGSVLTISGPSRPVLQVSAAAASRTAPPSVSLTPNRQQQVPPAQSQSQVQVVGPRVLLMSPPKQAPSSRPALAVSQPQNQPGSPSRLSSGYSVLTIVPSTQRTVAQAPAPSSASVLPTTSPSAQCSTSINTFTSASASSAHNPSSSSLRPLQPNLRPSVVLSQSRGSGILRPSISSSSFSGTRAQPTATAQLRLSAPGARPGSSPLVRLTQPILQRTSASTAASAAAAIAASASRGSVQQRSSQSISSRKRVIDADDEDWTPDH